MKSRNRSEKKKASAGDGGGYFCFVKNRLSVSEWPVVREEESTFQLVQAVRRAMVVERKVHKL